MHVAIVGYGSAGKRHLRNFRELGAEVCVADPSGLRHAQMLATSPDIPFYDTFKDLLRDRQIDAAVICTPPHLHLEMLHRAIGRDVHCLVEKPLSTSSMAVSLNLPDEIAKRQLKVMVGYNMRLHPVLQRARSHIRSGLLGDIHYIRAHCGQYLPDWHPGEDYRKFFASKASEGGGALLEMSHEIDFVPWLIGQQPMSVSCITRCVPSLEMDAENLVELSLTFSGGPVASIHLDMLDRVFRRNILIVCSHGSLEVDLVKNTLCMQLRLDEEILLEYPTFERNQLFMDEATSFLECVQNGDAATPSIEDGLQVLRIVAAARTSAESGEVIHL